MSGRLTPRHRAADPHRPAFADSPRPVLDAQARVVGIFSGTYGGEDQEGLMCVGFFTISAYLLLDIWYFFDIIRTPRKNIRPENPFPYKQDRQISAIIVKICYIVWRLLVYMTYGDAMLEGAQAG